MPLNKETSSKPTIENYHKYQLLLDSHIHIQIYAEHNQSQYTNFNEQMNTLLYKDISLTLYSWKG